jgi:UDP-N-acetylmuramoyl-L-alanyl-D-glutamate--2,6-diaminopimelate ligase
MEVSSHSIVQRRIGGVTFQAGVLTNITGDHLDYHKTREAYRDAKSLFFEELPRESVAVLNGADPACGLIAARTTARVIPYTLDGWQGLTACRVSCSKRIAMMLRDADGGLSVEVAVWGRYNAENLMAAVCCARALAVPWEPIEEALLTFTPPPGRFEEVASNGFRVFVDYAHTPTALESVLATARAAVDGGRLIVVFGCGGDRDRTKRPAMGRLACTGADMVVVTSDNPRTEKPSSIIAEILAGVPRDAGTVVVEEDRRAAIRRACEAAGHGDVVVIAGKGHEDYQITGTERRHFDDREVVREILEERTRACV